MSLLHPSRRALGRGLLGLSLLPLGACASLPSLSRAPASDPLLSDLHRRTFQFFWDVTDHRTGLTPDRWPTRTFASVAAIGFAFNAYIVGAESGYIRREQAAERTFNTLNFLYNLPQGEAASGTAGYKGYFYHFLRFDDGTRYKTCELSSIDTSLLLMGALCAGQYFDRDTPVERDIRRLSTALYERVDWTFMMRPSGRQTMGWHPEDGFIKAEWRGYNEGMMVYLLAMASPTHPIDPKAYQVWCSTYDETFGPNHGEPHLGFHALFGHQYNHVWIDYRGIADGYMRGKGLDYFENSRRATLAQRNYAIQNPMGFRDYGPDIWGFTACDGPADVKLTLDGVERQFRSYSARGPGDLHPFDDGTIAPTAALGSIMFTPVESLAAARAMRARYGADIYGQYGFFDSFNPTFVTDYPSREGHQTQRAGWVSNDYIGIDQGPILCGIENLRSGLFWRLMKGCAPLQRGLKLAGFEAVA
ncbi:glucoamylase family protein [Asticcacaulis sp.]|uniref:glucoamylase family protein n=1 Tax=Asticcacaulis sp. TaxID=1872648 RepID=UPI0039194F83